eukprot:Rmarinus@m.12395
MALQHQLSTLKVMKSVEKSSELMKLMNEVIRIPEVRGACMNMGKEMMKAGFIEDMIDDAIDSTDMVEEGEVDAEVQKVLNEITAGISAQLHEPSTAPLPTEAPAEAVSDGEEDLESMKARLESLRTA